MSLGSDFTLCIGNPQIYKFKGFHSKLVVRSDTQQKQMRILNENRNTNYRFYVKYVCYIFNNND